MGGRLANDRTSDQVRELRALQGKVLSRGDSTDDELAGLCDCESWVSFVLAPSERGRTLTYSDRVDIGRSTGLNADERKDESEDKGDEGYSAKGTS